MIDACCKLCENLAGTYYNVVDIFVISFLHYWALFLVTFHGRTR
jgi:hypothetical protein